MSLEAKQLALSTPEELMARVEDASRASIRLTWFFDEDTDAFTDAFRIFSVIESDRRT